MRPPSPNCTPLSRSPSAGAIHTSTSSSSTASTTALPTSVGSALPTTPTTYAWLISAFEWVSASPTSTTSTSPGATRFASSRSGRRPQANITLCVSAALVPCRRRNDEQPFFIAGCQRDWDALPRPDGPLTVGIDGGYVHARDGDNRKAGWFELIVGKSVPTGGAAKCFGFVTSYDTKPKRRLAELLKAQGLQMNQEITFLSDGGDNVRDLQLYLSPLAEHLLDWFHITMRITVLRQQLKELIATAPDHDLVKLDDELERLKWYLWHGNVFQALQVVERVQWQLEDLEEEVPASCKLAKTVVEFHSYITANEAFIPNYGERYRYDEVISTAFVESTVNQVISKRFVKKQQMRWTKKGAHLLLQVRAQVLNEDLRPTFERWYWATPSTHVSAVLAA